MDEYGRLEDEGKMALLLRRSVDRVEGEAGDRVDECVMEEVRMWRQKQKVLVFGGSPHEPGPPITPQTLPPLNP